MNRIRVAAVVTLGIALALAAGAAPAKAFSMGAYGSVGAGFASWDEVSDWDGNGGADAWDGDSRHTGGGFAMEAPSGIYRVSYRLNIGWERVACDGDRNSPDLTLEGIVFDQDFTYDIAVSPTMRFWVGPELRLGFMHGSFDNAGDVDKSFFAAGIGPVLGFDVALSQSVALSWKFGYLFTSYYSDQNSWDNGNGHRDDHYDYYYDDNSIQEGHGYASLAILFRVGGGPQPGPQPPLYQPQGRW